MVDVEQQSSLAGRVRVLQVIIAAMAVGVVALLVVVFVVHAKVGAVDKAHNLKVLTQIALGYGVVALIGGPILAAALVNAGRRRFARSGRPAQPAEGKASGFESDLSRGDASMLTSLLVSKTIISGAIYEGAAVFLAVAFLLNRNFLTGACSVIMVVALLMQMPTKGRVSRWIEEQLRHLEQERQAGR